MDKPTIIKVLSKLRYLFKDISYGEDYVMKQITNYPPSKHMAFPCDVIDLRKVLVEEKIEHDDYIPLFSLQFAEKHLKRYPLFLVIDVRKVDKDTFRYGGLCILRDNELDIEKSLTRIVVNKQADDSVFEVVQNMMKELNKRVECVVSNSVPGMSSKLSHNRVFKAAQGVGSELPLDPKEKNIFDFLRTVKKDYNLPVQMRVAGGWVRDKLLGRESDDIDIAVDMPGYDFAKLIAEASVKYNVSHDPKAYKVSLEKSADPAEQAPDDKLMVGAVNLFGQKIEFVPMRTEHYPDPDSRQPAITNTNDPREDVKRRDLTINALYYNIDTGKVEDYVGGRKDLGTDPNGAIVLRTPDDAHKTFHEDPLRLLRVLRFHSRYPNSVVDPSIIEAMQMPDVQESYMRKVATERAGPEIMKMMAGEDPVDSIKLLFDTGLYKQVFKVPSMESVHPDGMNMDQQTPYHKYSLKDHTIEVVKNLNNLMREKGETDKMRGLMNAAALFHDFGKMQAGIRKPHPKGNRLEDGREQMQYINHEKASKRMADQILKSIGVGKDDRDIVKMVIDHHMVPHQMGNYGNKGMGKFLRKTRGHGKDEEHKDLWKYIFYHAQADSMSSQPDNYDPDKNQADFDKFQKFVESPVGQFSGTVINGTDIKALFPDLNPSTGYIKEVLDFVKAKQDEGVINVNVDINAAKQKAIDLVNTIAPDIINKYKEPTMGTSWYNKIKTSNTISKPLSVPQTDDPEVHKGPKPMDAKYQIGMRVRDRRKGLVIPQDFGIVSSIEGDMMTITWSPDNKNKKKDEKYNMVEDTAKLSTIVSED